MAEVLNYAEQYGRELASAYPYTLQFGALWENDNTKRYELDKMHANTIYLPDVNVKGTLEDGNRDTIGTFTRKSFNEWEVKKLRNHKTWNDLLHPMDVVQTNMVVTIKNATRKYNETVKFPYLDSLMLTTVYNDSKEVLKGANVRQVDLTVNNILSTFDEMMDVMDDAFIPQTRRILYVPTKVKTLIDNCKDIYRISGQKVLGRAVSRIDEVQVLPVPTKAMTTSDGQLISMFLVHPSLILPICNYAFSGVEAPSVHSQGKYLYFEEFFTDVFILDKKAEAVQYVIPKATEPENPDTPTG